MDQATASQEHRLKRIALWASLWLARLLSCLPVLDKAPLPEAARLWLDRRLAALAAMLARIILIRGARAYKASAQQRDRAAIARAYARAAQAPHIRQARQMNLRAAIGGRLRRALRLRGSLQERAQIILRALQNQDVLLARFARRMRKGLSRRMALHTRALAAFDSLAVFVCADLAGEPQTASAARLADTS